jgi:hypothetical protein
VLKPSRPLQLSGKCQKPVIMRYTVKLLLRSSSAAALLKQQLHVKAATLQWAELGQKHLQHEHVCHRMAMPTRQKHQHRL